MNIAWYVERALKTWPETRDSDRKLIISVWWLQDNNYQEHFKEFFLHKAIMPETITRARRKFQEQGLYRASATAEANRFDKFKQMRETTPRTNDVDYIMGIFNN